MDQDRSNFFGPEAIVPHDCATARPMHATACMRAVAFTCIAASLAACAKPGRGEHLVHWPQVIAALALDASGIYASVATGQVLRIPLEGGVAEPVAAVADGCLS